MTKEGMVGSKVQVGEYIRFGKYNNEPILWRGIHQENNRLLLFSEYIISYKPFDSKEGTEYSDDSDRQNYGGNRWSESNIRDWLNSEKKQVDYTSNAPTKDGVWSGYNAYSDEAGFLNSFSDREKELIQADKHKVLLPEFDQNEKESGDVGHEFECAYPDIALRNYDNAYFESVTDKVFLLSIKEVKEYVLDNGWEWYKTPTKKAAESDESNNQYTWYWLRTVTAADSHGVRDVSSDGYLDCRSAYRGTLGIVPALYVSISDTSIKSGDGTKENPYVIG